MALDLDIEWDDALALLSEPETGKNVFSRRAFLQAAAAGVAGTALATMPGMLRGREAWAAGPVKPNDGILVTFAFFGGNDGLNTLVPYGNARYYQLRSSIGIPQANVIPITSSVGLHPNLVKTKAMFDQGTLAIIQGVGYPNPSLSHFDGMATWMAGHSSGGNPGSGWIGRYLDGLPLEAASLNGVSIGTSVPLLMKGNSVSGIGLPTSMGSVFGTSTDVAQTRMYDAVKAFSAGPQRGQWGDRLATNERDTLDLGNRLLPAYQNITTNGIVRQLTLAAKLINANLGIRVINLGFGGFDNHAGERGSHDGLMTALDNALQAFFATLAPQFARQVTVMSYSEFGRRPQQNDSAGTDHGTASCLFVAGANVRGGLYGEYPSLTSLDRSGNLVFSVDFRSVYTSVLGPWLGADAKQVIGAAYEDLNLFRAVPGVDPAIGGDGGPLGGGSGSYWLVTSLGTVLSYGTAANWGNAPAGVSIAAMAARPQRDGYWLVEPGGAVYAFGQAKHAGDMAGARLSGPIVGMASTPTGNGYVLLGYDGGLFCFGDAAFYGSMGATRLNAPIVGLAPTPTGRGYWLVASDGGVFSFGDAPFFGSMGAVKLNAPVVAIAATASGRGYWLAAADGGMFSFGDAAFKGSAGSFKLNQPIVGMQPTPTGKGYWLVASDGGVFTFGDAAFGGSGAGQGHTIVGMSA
jgi:uncharacterized protein (DUF1501 family)